MSHSRMLFVLLLTCMAGTLFASAPPRNLHGSFHNGLIALSWSKPESEVTPLYYFVYRSVNGAVPFIHIGTADNTEFEDAPIASNTFYRYKVTAYNPDSTESLPSNTVEIFTRDSLYAWPPRNLEAKFNGTDILLDWDAPETPATPSFYKVYRSAGMHIPGQIGSSTGTAYDDTTVTLKTLYHYFVTSVYHDTLESMPSRIVEIYTGDFHNHDSDFVRMRFTSEPRHYAFVNQRYSYDAEVATVPAGVPVCFRLAHAPDGMTLENSTGVIQWTPTHTGCFEVELRAHPCDTLRGEAEQEFRLYVLSGPPSSVAGSVKNLSGEGLRNVRVKLFDVARGEFVMRTETNDSGNYQFPIVNPATYYVRARPDNRSYKAQWYDGADRIEHATPVVVPESTKIRVDFTLLARDTARDIFRLSGTVMDSASNPLRGARVFVSRAEHDEASDERFDDHDEEFEHARSAVTDSNGHYLFELHEGTFILGAFAEHYMPQFWNHKPTPLEADRLHLTGDSSGIDFNLTPKPIATGSISGRILNAADSTPVESHVIAFHRDAAGHCTGWMTFTRTDSTGAYTLDHLKNGSYIILAKDEHDFVPTFYNSSGGTPYLDSASAVVVSGATVTGIDIYVSPDSVEGLNSVGGTVAINAPDAVVPLAGAVVTITGADRIVAGSAISQGDGSYIASGLAPGDYTVLFQKPGKSSAAVPISVFYRNNTPTITTVNAQLTNDDGSGAIGTMSLRAQWNLISVPVDVTDPHRSSLFPGASSSAFRYGPGGYQSADVLDFTSGYWLKFPALQVVNLDGAARSSQTIPITAGWNLIGSISTPVSVASLQMSQPNLMSRNIFGYSGGYSIATTIDPGKGYWVKANANGTITLSAGSAEMKYSSLSAQLNELSSITIRDEHGNKQILYVGSASIDVSQTDLPPVAPAGIFDVRFASQRFVELHAPAMSQERSYGIQLQSVDGPLTVSWSVKPSSPKYVLIDGARTVNLSGNGSVQLNSAPARLNLSVQPTQAPKEFSLHQNYPNPFNPVTKISFDLPSAATVTLKVYNVIGQEIATLINNTAYDAGQQSVSFDASRFGSGMYFYKLQAGSWSSVKKMMLIK